MDKIPYPVCAYCTLEFSLLHQRLTYETKLFHGFCYVQYRKEKIPLKIVFEDLIDLTDCQVEVAMEV